MNPNQHQTTHIPTIHALRGLAAVAVCLFHFVNTTTGLFDSTVQESFKYGKHGVQMFFVISGFVIPYSMHSGGYNINAAFQFLKKRLIRLEPTYIVSIFFALGILFLKQFLSESYTSQFPPLQNISLHLGYLIPFFPHENWINPVYWTLAIEFQYYILICLFFPAIFTSSNTIRVISIITLCLLGMLINEAGFIFVHMPCFMFGIGYVLYKVDKISRSQLILILAISSATLWKYRGIPDVVTAHLTLALIIAFPEIKTRLFDYLGNISYSLYLVHSIIGAAVLNFLTHKVSNPAEKILAVVIAFVVSIVTAHIMYKLVEKPSHQLAKRIKLTSILQAENTKRVMD